MSGYGMSFYDYMHEREYEDEQHRARAVGDYPTDAAAHQRSLELQEQHELESERERLRIAAVRTCLTRGVPMDTIYLLCEELGISFNKVSGG
jgi:hypothetical protein